MKIAQLRVDAKLSQGGVWTPIIEDFEVLVAQWQNPDHKEALADLARDGVDAENAEERALMVAPLVKDWRGLQDDAGKPVPCTPESALNLLRDPGMVWVMDKIQIASMQLDAYRQKQLEDDAKN